MLRLSGYQLFLRECIAELKVRYPDSRIVLSIVIRLCAQCWKDLDEKRRKTFTDKADILNASIKKSYRQIKKRRMEGPRFPLMRAFILFFKANRNFVKRANPRFTMGQVSSVLGVLWDQSSRKIKTKYVKMALKEKRRYKDMEKEKMAAYLKEADKEKSKDIPPNGNAE